MKKKTGSFFLEEGGVVTDAFFVLDDVSRASVRE